MMNLQQRLRSTPVELLLHIFDSLTFTELDALERACANPHLRPIFADHFHHRVIRAPANSLLELAQIGRTTEIQYLALCAGVDMNVRDQQGRTPLHLTSERGFLSALEALLQCPRVDVHCRDVIGRSALVLAAQNGHKKVAETLLRHGASVAAVTDAGESALLWAARNGHEHVVALLIAEGADPLSKDAEGWTALDWAVMNRHNATMNPLFGLCALTRASWAWESRVLLLAAEAGNDAAVQRVLLAPGGPNIDCRDEQESTPLHWAASCGHHSTARLLLDHGADPNASDEYGNSPMHWAIAHPAIVFSLLACGAEADRQNNAGRTSLMWGSGVEHTQASRLLLEVGGANVNAQDINACTALHAAAATGNGRMVRLLLDSGADVTAKDVDGWTPLDAATVNGHEEVMAMLMSGMRSEAAMEARPLPTECMTKHTRWLLSNMALQKVLRSDGLTGLRCLVNRSHTHRLLAALESGVGVDEQDPLCGATALTLAAWFNELRAVTLLLGNGAAVDARDGDGRTALHVAVESGYCDLMVLLLERGASIDARFCGWTPLLLAAKRSWHETGRWAVKHLAGKVSPAGLAARDYHGRAALHWCAVYGDAKTVTTLLRLGESLDPRDHCGQSPLHLAIGARRVDIVRALLGQGANPVGRTEEGLTPAHAACYTGQLDVLGMLSEVCNVKGSGARSAGPKSPAPVLRLNVKDAAGYSALDIAHLTGNLHVVQFLHRHLGGDEDGDHLQLRSDIPYTVLRAWEPPPLALPTEVEIIDMQRDWRVARPSKPMFSPDVRAWLRGQVNKWVEPAVKLTAK